MAQAAKKKIFDGRYEILAIVGRGAASVVYHARHVSDPSTEVALKVLLAEKDGSPTAQRLRKEALAMVSSRHRYVIRLDDFHSVGELSYLSMEFAPESDLRKFIAKRGGSLPKAQIELFLLQAAEALGFVHQAGIVHRDIKPDNLLVINDKEIRLADFGSAVLPGEPASIEELQKGVGTFDYMAPETIDGKACDKRSDVYALGVSFYEILSGRHPFADAPMAKLLDVRRDENVKPISEAAHGVPPHLAQAIMRAMRFDPSERFATARDLVQSLLAARTPGEKVLSVISGSNGAASREEDHKTPAAEAPISKDKAETVRAAMAQAMPSGSNLAYKVEEDSDAELAEESVPTEEPANVDDEELIESKAAESSVIDDIEESPVNSRKTEHRSLSGGAFDFQGPTDSPKMRAPNPKKSPAKSAKRREDSPTSTNLTNRPPPKQPIPAAPAPKARSSFSRIAIAACLCGFAVWYHWRGSTQSTAVETLEPEQTQQTEEVNEPESAPQEMSKDISRNSGNFPYMAPGVYHGSIDGLIPGRKVPLSLLSFEEPRITVVILGIEGWRPTTALPIETRNDDGSVAKVEARAASNGLVIQLRGAPSGAGWVGGFTNVLTGETGEWSADRQ